MENKEDQKIFAPFTEEQVDKLLAWQENGMTVPYTCCSYEGCAMPNELNNGILIPKTDGWICPCKKYTQDWAYVFMVRISITESVLMDGVKNLTRLAQELLKLAKKKGFSDWIQYFDPFEIKTWRHDEFKFSTIVCSVIQLWLRKNHNIVVWIEPVHAKYKGLIDFRGNYQRHKEETSSGPSSCELQLIEALTIVLNQLPDELK